LDLDLNKLDTFGSEDLRQISEYPIPMESTTFLHPEEEIPGLIDLPQG
jgi:hypothetical protein